MNDFNFVLDAIHRQNRNRLLICIALLILIAGLLWVNANYLYNFFNGPFQLTAQEVLATESLEGTAHTFGTLRGDDVLDTGYQYVSTEYGRETIEANYHALVLGDRLLLVKTSEFTPKVQVMGALVPIPSEIQREVIAELENEDPDVRGMFLPFMFDTSDFRTPGYVGLAVGAVVVLICLYMSFMTISRIANVNRHPIMKRLALYGPVESVIEQINRELRAPHTTVENLHFTPSWIVFTRGASLEAMRPQDIMWMYKQMTQHRVNYIRVRKTFSAIIFDRYGKKIIVPAKDQVVDEILKRIYALAPWVIVGYVGDMQQQWNKDRAAFITTVDFRRSNTPRS